MDDPDRPPLAPYIYEEIEVDLHEVDKTFWSMLEEMQVSILTFAPALTLPRRPLQLKGIVVAYIHALFYEEVNRYPRGHQSKHWLEKLSERIKKRIMRVITQVEKNAAAKSLSYHGVTEAEMHEIIDSILHSDVEKYFKDIDTPAIVEPSVKFQRKEEFLPSSKGESSTEIRGERDPVVAARRAELRNMLRSGKSPTAIDVCRRWDSKDIKVPESWKEEGITSWQQAFQKQTHRGRTKKLISNDSKLIQSCGR